MRTRRTKTWKVQASEALLIHVKLDEGRQDGVVLHVQVPWRRHRHQRLDSRQRHKPAYVKVQIMLRTVGYLSVPQYELQ